MKQLLVTGTDTDVGKTWISCLLIRKLRKAGLNVGAYKPVCSGAEFDADGNLYWHDVHSLRQAVGEAIPTDQICPQRFRAPIAPNVAAIAEKRSVDNALLYDGVAAWRKRCDFLLIEGAGGIMCPLSDTDTVLDMAIKLKSPIVIVADNRLGVINHTMLTVETALRHQLKIAAVILNQRTVAGSDEDPSRQSNAAQLRHWLPDIRLLHCGPAQTELLDTNQANGAADLADLFD